jgi:hypothetical protein
VLILLIAAMLLKLQVLAHPLPPAAVDGHYLYGHVLQIMDVVYHGNAFAYTFTSVIMLFLQALYFKSIASRHKLYPRSTYLPALSFLLLTSIFPAFNFFSCTLLINWCMLGGIDTLLSFSQTHQPRKQVFNAGFIICIAALLQFSAIAYILLFFIGLALLRSFSISEWVVGAMGYFTPIYFYVCILFLMDELPLMAKWPHLGLSLPTHLSAPGYFIISISGLLILFVCGFYAMQQQIAKNSVYGRRIWSVIIIYLVLSLLVAVFTDLSVTSAWLLIIPPSAFIITHGISLEKSKRFSNFTFYFFLVFVLACQLAIK